MYEIIATAAAGIQAGAGLHAAIAGPRNGDGSAKYFHSRSRFLSLVLERQAVDVPLQRIMKVVGS